MTTTGDGCAFADCTSGFNHLITTISPPSTVGLCDEHYAPGLIPLLAAELGVDPTALYAHIEKFLNRVAKQAERELADAQAAEAAKGSEGPTGVTAETCSACGRISGADSMPCPSCLESSSPADFEEPTDEHEETGLFHGSGEEAL